MLDRPHQRGCHLVLADSMFDKRTKVPLKDRGFLIGQSLRDGLANRRHEWIGGTGQEALPGLGVHPWFDIRSQFQVHLVETRHGHEHEKVSLIEVDHGVVHGVLDAVVERFELGNDVVNGRNVVATEGAPVVRDDEAVDRLEKGKSSARSQHSVALPEARQLVLHVDQHGTDRDDIDRRVVDFPKIINSAEDKPASVQDTCLSRVVPAQAEQVSGEVVKNHPARRTGAFESAEADQPVTRPEVKDDVSFFDVRSIEQAVSKWGQEGGKQLATELVVSAVAMLDDPLTPRVAVRVIHHSEYRTHDGPCPLQAGDGSTPLAQAHMPYGEWGFVRPIRSGAPTLCSSGVKRNLRCQR